MRARSIVGSSIGLAALVLIAGIAATSCTQNAAITSSRYALVYGVSTYVSTVDEGKYAYYYNGDGYYRNLTYSDNDAVDVAALMKAQGWNVRSRVKGTSDDTTDDKPTKAQMKADIATVATEADPNSTVLFFFSGHGTQDEDGNSYIIPYEGYTDSSSPSFTSYDNCVSPSDLSSMLETLPTKNIIVIFDSCYSGGFVDSGSAIDSSPSSYAAMQSYSAFSTAMANFGSLLVANAAASGSKTPIVISAAGSDEYSYDGSGNGVFTGYLLDSATSGDDDDGYITTTEVYAYTAKKIKAYDENNSYSIYPFLPHLSGGTRDLVLFTK